jgi:hypothetical protein
MQYKIPIPHFYQSLAANALEPDALADEVRKKFKKYVTDYIENTHPGWELNRIEGTQALLKRRENHG